MPRTTLSTDTVTITDKDGTDDLFDPPYASVADWWQQTDCRVMRIAVGDDNQYPDRIADDDDPDTDVTMK